MQTEMQQVKFIMNKVQEDKEIAKFRHRREKSVLMKYIMALRDFVRSLKMTIKNLKKDRQARMEIQKKLHEELQTLRVINNKLQKKYETVMAIELDMQLELERV